MVNDGDKSLLVQGDPNSGKALTLTGRPITFGRPDNDDVVDETTVSRRHAIIMETPTGFVLRDLVFGGIKNQRVGGRFELVGNTGRKWVMPDETIFLGQIGPVILLIIGDEEVTVQEGLGYLFEALEAAAP